MADEGFKRKLAAILSADVEGYSRLMDEDEEATVRTLNSYRTAISNLVQKFRGRIVDTPGDNILVEFTSVVDAVSCALDIQKELAEQNAELPDERKMQFRIGVNLGDVIEEEGRIYGNGVNIAARLEGLADAGGICISGNAFGQVKGKLSLGYQFVGEQTVKNIPDPVRAYKVLMDERDAGKLIDIEKKASKSRWLEVAAVILFVVFGLIIYQFYSRQPAIEPASVEKMAYPLPDKPSIAVLPFDNMAANPEREFLGDALTDQIINGLSKIPNLFVISRNSSFTYKGKPVKVQKVAEELGVQYVLEGSVQRSTDRVRITAQLIDAITGRHKWSESYDRDMEDIFAIQDDITMAITKALNIELGEGEQARHWHEHSTTNLKAYLKYLEGQNYFNRATKEDKTRARQLFEEALALDPDWASPYAFIGFAHYLDARYGWVESRAESIKKAFQHAQKAIELNENSDTAHLVIGAVYVVKRQHEKAITEAERVIDINPNGSSANAFMAGTLGCAGRWQEGIGYAKKAVRLAPFPPVGYLWILGRAYFMTDQYDKAVETFKKAVHMNPDYLVARAFLAASYSSLDRQEEAAAEAREVLRINPKFTLDSYAKTLPYKNKADIERYIVALRKAGLK